MFGLIPFTNNTNDLGESFKGFLNDFFNNDFFVSMPFKGMEQLDAQIKETDNEYLVSANLPGVDKENINLDYENNTLSIMAKCQKSYNDNSNGFTSKSSCISEFSRSFYLDNVKSNEIRAKFDNGVLKIILPKKTPQVSAKSKIPIE